MNPTHGGRLKELNPETRHLDSANAGSLSNPGYSRLGRTPRVPGFDECVSLERADRIEQMMKEYPPMNDGY